MVCLSLMAYVGDFGKLDILDSHLPLWDRESGPLILSKMGKDGREAYAIVNTIDFLFPLFYATFIADILYSRGYVLGTIISMGAGLFDLFENSCVRILLNASKGSDHSNYESIALDFGPLFTRLKWGFLSCALILLVFSSFTSMQRKRKDV
jgi:hypothetical protein